MDMATYMAAQVGAAPLIVRLSNDNFICDCSYSSVAGRNEGHVVT